MNQQLNIQSDNQLEQMQKAIIQSEQFVLNFVELHTNH